MNMYSNDNKMTWHEMTRNQTWQTLSYLNCVVGQMTWFLPNPEARSSIEVMLMGPICQCLREDGRAGVGPSRVSKFEHDLSMF